MGCWPDAAGQFLLSGLNQDVFGISLPHGGQLESMLMFCKKADFLCCQVKMAGTQPCRDCVGKRGRREWKKSAG